MDKVNFRKAPSNSNRYKEILPLYPLSPRPILRGPVIVSPRNESRPRTSSLQRTNATEGPVRATNTLPTDNKIQKEFIIKTSKDRRTPEKRRTTPSKQNLQTLFKKVDQEEEKDFLDLIDQLQ